MTAPQALDISLEDSFSKKQLVCGCYDPYTGSLYTNGSENFTELALPWKSKDKMRTAAVGLVVCLNVGVDPPDVAKPSPCARLECWVDPFLLASNKALESIGKRLQEQYERWQPRARYKQCLDPTVEDVKKLCHNLRRQAKDERVLFHFNGHGVPKPTVNGEVWVFNKNFTQYVPLSVWDLNSWLGSPAVYVLDCSAAGHIVSAFQKILDQRRSSSTSASTIILAACGAGEILPQSPTFPADLFTSCLTTPVKTALRWFCARHPLGPMPPELVDLVPGKLNDRKTTLGEINWVFTAITDTIAWSVLPTPMFHQLFRQDLLVASIFRNFLLADRVMRSAGCTPLSYPALPATHRHPLWKSWDHAADLILSHVQRAVARGFKTKEEIPPMSPLSFFSEHLTALEVWLQSMNPKAQSPPQLPIVLQVLLSQVHRARALKLLCQYMDRGPEAIHQALSVGIFPYVLKLLHSQSADLPAMLVCIWAKILAYDVNVRNEITRESGYRYFIQFSRTNAPAHQRSLALAVLSMFANGFRDAQSLLLQDNVLALCCERLQEDDPITRRWALICMSCIWSGFHLARQAALQGGPRSALNQVQARLSDTHPEVRLAAASALVLFMNRGTPVLLTDPDPTSDEGTLAAEMSHVQAALCMLSDGSKFVRRELVVLLSTIFSLYRTRMAEMAHALWPNGEASSGGVMFIREADGDWLQLWSADASAASTPDSSSQPLEGQHDFARDVDSVNEAEFFSTVLCAIFRLSKDPCLEVARPATAMLRSIQHDAGMPMNAWPRASNSPTIQPQQTPNQSRIKRLWSGSSPSLKPMQAVDESKVPWSDAKDDPSSLCSTCFSDAAFKLKYSFMRNPNPETAARQRFKKDFAELETQRLANTTASAFPLQEQLVALDLDHCTPRHVLFHPAKPFVVTVDNTNKVCVWDYTQDSSLHTSFFSCNHPCTVSGLELLHPLSEHSGHLVISSSDGYVRIWSDAMNDEIDAKQRAAFHGAPELSAQPNSCMVTHACGSTLTLSGDTPFIRVWDLERERNVTTIMHGSAKHGTTALHVLNENSSSSPLVFAGCNDGSVRLFDTRASCSRAHSIMQLHHESVISLSVRQDPMVFDPTVYSSASDGRIAVADLRNSELLQTFTTMSHVSSMAVHTSLPLIACGSSRQNVSVYNTQGSLLNTIKHHDGFLGQRIGGVGQVRFHPTEALLAVAGTDGIVSLFASASSIFA